MTTSACGTCAKQVDPLRSRYVRVIGTRIAAYCSAECRDGNTPAVAFVPTPAPVPVPVPVPAPAPAPAPIEVIEIAQPIPVVTAKPSEPATLATDIVDKLSAPATGSRFRKVGWIGGGVVVLSLGTAVWISITREETHVAVAAPSSQVIVDEQAAMSSPRERALSALASLSSRAARPIRLRAAAVLAQHGDGPAKQVLAELIADGSAVEKIDAAFALALAGDTDAPQLLAELTQAKQRHVRMAAARALAKLGNPAAKTALEDLFFDKTGGWDWSAAESLAQLGDTRAITRLKSGLTDKYAELRMRSALALGMRGDAAAEPALRNVLSDGRYQLGAAVALVRLGAKDVEPQLIDGLRYTAVRGEAARALRSLGRSADGKWDAGRVAIAQLESDLMAGDAHARLSAAEALLALTAKEAPVYAPPIAPVAPAPVERARAPRAKKPAAERPEATPVVDSAETGGETASAEPAEGQVL